MIRRFSRFILGAIVCAAVAVVPPNVVDADQPLKVVTTLSTFADLVKQVGGDRVEVAHVASPRFNPHFIEPRPSDVLKVKRADLFVHAGLDLEAWRGPLLDAAGNPGIFPGQPGELDLSQGVSLLEVPEKPLSRLMGDIHIYGNPHYWLDPENVRIMARAIGEKLSAVDPKNEKHYRWNFQEFLQRLDRKIPEWQSQLTTHQGQELIGYHNEWPYLMKFLGLKMEQFLEPKPGIPPTPKQIAFLGGYIRQRRIRAIVQPTFYPRSAAEALAKRAPVRVVTLCQNVGEIKQASDYFALIDYNIQQLARGLEGGADG